MSGFVLFKVILFKLRSYHLTSSIISLELHLGMFDTPSIMHHFSTELLSTSNSVLIPYLNTNSPFAMDFHLTPTIIIHSLVKQPSSTMSNPDDLNSVFKDTYDRRKDLTKSKHILKLKQSFQSLQST